MMVKPLPFDVTYIDSKGDSHSTECIAFSIVHAIEQVLEQVPDSLRVTRVQQQKHHKI